MKKLIENWLNGKQNFLVGRILYKQYGKDETLKALFGKGEKEPGAREALLKALQELVAQEVNPTEIEQIIIMPASDDPVCASIQADWKVHYTRMNMLRGQLSAYGTDNSPEVLAASKALCLQILEEEQYINVCWAKLNHYHEHGKLSDVKEGNFVIPEDPVAVGKLIESLKRNIRRNKRKAAENPAQPTFPALVKLYEDRLNEVLNETKNRL